MKNTFKSIFLVLVLLGLASCGSKQFTQGKYDDINEDRLLDDQFNESDMRRIAETMVQSLSESRVISSVRRPPVVLVTLVRNKTAEHIDMKSMTDKIRTSLIKSGKFRFTEKEVREEIAGELDYQGESGYVDSTTARKKGKQIGAEYFLTGEITSRIQEVGKKKYIYYKANFNLVNIDTGIIDWSDEKELRKFYQKRSVGM